MAKMKSANLKFSIVIFQFSIRWFGALCEAFSGNPRAHPHEVRPKARLIAPTSVAFSVTPHSALPGTFNKHARCHPAARLPDTPPTQVEPKAQTSYTEHRATDIGTNR
jgi:hypothetical protein